MYVGIVIQINRHKKEKISSSVERIIFVFLVLFVNKIY